MSDRIVVIIATGESAKARTGLLYATNALKHQWLADVQLFFFGPAEALLTRDEDLQEMLREFRRQGDGDRPRPAVACRFIADRERLAGELAGLDVEVAYVGSPISDLIKRGYVPLVW